MRFRKSIQILPGVRITASKRGLSTSIGGKGLRVTRGADGKTRTTVGIPGTGLSQTNVVSSAPRQQPIKSRYGWKFWLFCFILFAVFLGAMDKHSPKPMPRAQTQTQKSPTQP